MLTVNTMIDIDANMTHLAVHGVNAPSQNSQPVGGLAGATGEDGVLTPMLAPLDGITDLLADYTDAKTGFETELGAAIGDAQEASASLRAPEEETTKDEAVVKEAKEEPVPQPTEAAAPKPSMEMQVVAAENERAAIGRMEAFVNRYNEVTRILEKNRGVSDRVASLAAMFSTSSKAMGALSAMGIVADEGGTLRVNAEQVKSSLKAQSGGTESARETARFAARAEKNLRLASFNQKRLFPSVSSVIGREENAAKSMYSAKASAAKDDFGSRGAIFNLYY